MESNEIASMDSRLNYAGATEQDIGAGLTTRAAVLAGINHPLEIWDLVCPPLGKGQVLVRMVYAGLCATQLLEMEGKKGEDRYLPHTLGHEGSGIVLEVGEGVSKVSRGDHVVLSWIKGSGLDSQRTVYKKDGQAVNAGAASAFLEKVIVSENRLTPIDQSLPLEIAALLGCAVPTGAGIVFNRLKVGKESTIAIFGIGGIGASAILAAQYSGCSKVIAVDVLDHKLDFARSLGATHTVNPRRRDALTAIMDLSGRRGVDYAIESAGQRDSMELAFEVISNSGCAVIAGNLIHKERISIDPFDLIKGKRIVGTWGGETNPDEDLPRYAKLYLSGELALDQLVSKVYRLDEINRAFADLKNAEVIRALIQIGEGEEVQSGDGRKTAGGV